MKILLKPENDSEAYAIESLLLEHGITNEVKSFHDTAYDGLYQSQHGWGVILVNESDFDRARQIVSEWEENAPKELPWKSGMTAVDSILTIDANQEDLSMNKIKKLIIAFSILMNIFFLFYYFGYIGGPIETYEPSKVYDKNGILMYESKFKPGSEFAYESYGFLPNGDVLDKFIDANENGRSERIIQYFKSITITSVDSNENGIFEVLTIIFKNGSSKKYYDKDENGIYETIEIIDSKNRIIAIIHDKNQDEFNDEINIVVSEGEKEILPITAYDRILNKINN